MKAAELHARLAEKVRGDSKFLADLTSAHTISPAKLGLNGDDVEANLAQLVANNDNFLDIQSVKDPTGKVYYFSATYMTANYARILARVKANDPCLTIAETVRDESRTYPRVTNVELFKYALFKIDRDELDQYVASLEEQYEDIKTITTRTGSRYLYSTLYLTPDRAALLAKRQEHPDS